MTRTIKFFDTTLRDGEQTPRVNLNIREKMEIAKQLEMLGVDIIEAGFPNASPGDFNAVREIAKTVRNCTIAGLCRSVNADIERAWEALKHAESPRLHVFIATSPVHMQYKLKMTEDQVVERAVAAVKMAKGYCSDVEFSAEDASRSDAAFLYRVIKEVIAAGATVVNIPDTVGYAVPLEFYELIKGVFANVPNIEKAEVSVHCHNDLGMATANSLAAIKAGANQVECTVNGLGERAGNAALEEVVMTLNTRRDYYGVSHNINTKGIVHLSRQVSSYTGVEISPTKAIVGGNAFLHESGIHQHGVMCNSNTYEIMKPEDIGLYNIDAMVLGKLSGKHAFEEKIKELGYHLGEKELAKAFEKFKELADKKKDILARDILSIVEGKVTEVPSIIELDNYQIFSGNKTSSTATITLTKGEESMNEAAIGDGPVDAAFKAIERLVGIEISLESYGLKAVTEGHDALGEVTVRIKYKNDIYMGKGVSTDVIEASILAYINALNRALTDTDSDFNECITLGK